MKKKIALSIIIFIVGLVFYIPNRTLAISSAGGYEIESYDVNMIVNENNTFDITETINVNFTGYNKHGIFRKIPLTNTVTRQDGTRTKNRAKISNININDLYTTSNEENCKILKIGNKDKTVSGRKTYIIKYNYNIGKDPLKNEDELYFNLIGTEWDTGINNVTFTITMPKTFDESKLGFSSGLAREINNSNINYQVTGKTIKGAVKEKLGNGKALTVRLTLPEGYFTGTNNNFDLIALIEMFISVIFVITAYALWRKYGKDDIAIETVEFYPPDKLNSAELGFIYKGYSDKKDIVSLLIYLANKGYLKIEEYEEKTLGIINSKKIRISKLKEYDGDNEDEKTFFDRLFEDGDEVTKSDLHYNFHVTLEEIQRHINRRENQEKIYERISLGKRLLIVAMIIIVFLFSGVCTALEVEMVEITMTFILILGFALAYLYKRANGLSIILASLLFTFASLTYMIDDVRLGGIYLIKFIVNNTCMILLMIFLVIIKKRTKYGTEMLGRILGFKHFLEIAEKSQLEELVMKEPEYFYNILPYTYVLGVSNKWVKKFEDILLESPSWYYGYDAFDSRLFNRRINSIYNSISRDMLATPGDSGSSGGGGFSGGGSGGGGGGSW